MNGVILNTWWERHYGRSTNTWLEWFCSVAMDTETINRVMLTDPLLCNPHIDARGVEVMVLLIDGEFLV
jgi:hypothetical protein